MYKVLRVKDNTQFRLKVKGIPTMKRMIELAYMAKNEDVSLYVFDKKGRVANIYNIVDGYRYVDTIIDIYGKGRMYLSSYHKEIESRQNEVLEMIQALEA